ncbi:MAG: DUF177 domain-containing protein [Bacteroidia bacterium]|nr:DUF177 domain-containing protein [Sphingobacteriaceae bacterium]MBK7310683.1 DUF177 domain-containing protein [Sphingobacteriaceae bacterium]MBP9068662.1 DUF177 domain-containing protein [Bacteroidia bacterium]
MSVGNHEFEFEVTGKFFKEHETSEVSDVNVMVKAVVLKQNNAMQIDFDLQGTVCVDCDRCLKGFDIPISGKEKLVIKYGNPDESTDDIMVVPEGETALNVSQYIYEYILTAVPARKVPCEIDKKLFKCDDSMLKKLKEVSGSEESEETNPIWEKLNKIKLNKN